MLLTEPEYHCLIAVTYLDKCGVTLSSSIVYAAGAIVLKGDYTDTLRS
jgi:hypothetical protein